MNKERLLKLADFLDTVPEERFDMEAWECGTAACALGRACRIPEFTNLGLGIEDFTKCGVVVPGFQGALGYKAGVRFFGVSIDDSVRFFHPGAYRAEDDIERPISKAEVAARIRAFVAHEDAKADADLKTENP